MVPALRIRSLNDHPPRPEGDWVVYWMVAFRRGTWNFALERAVQWAQDLGKPLVILEALRTGYRWASDRVHQFVIEGMADNARSFAARPVTYYPFLETTQHPGKGLLETLAAQACVVVTDDYPCFFLPRMIARAGRRLGVLCEAVDSNGVYPLRATSRVFTMAHSFRRHLQKELLPHLSDMPRPDPLAGISLPRIKTLAPDIRRRWPAADLEPLACRTRSLHQLPIDHSVPATATRGGHEAAQAVWNQFLTRKLAKYSEDRNHPQRDGSSGLSPYLHFGHISTHQLVVECLASESWNPSRLAPRVTGKASGWWGVAPSVEAFLDQLITWRELGFNACALQPDYDRFASLPNWALNTLDKHGRDRRSYLYGLDQWESSQTHDPLWNAAQRQLVREGRIHNYLRMLWGKKILEWTRSPAEALEIMIELNNKYALDGRDPNSYSGIFWILGRYDRAWGPERPVFGTVRYMSSASTARKIDVRGYLRQYA